MFSGSRYSVRGSRYSVRRFNKIKHVEQNLRTESKANVPRVSVRRFCSTGTKSQPYCNPQRALWSPARERRSYSVTYIGMYRSLARLEIEHHSLLSRLKMEHRSFSYLCRVAEVHGYLLSSTKNHKVIE